MPIDYAYHRFDKTTVSCRCPVGGHYVDGEVVAIEDEEDEDDEDP